MAEGRTGHPGLKFLWFIIFIDGRESLFGLIVRYVEEFEGIFDIVNPLAKKDKAIIVASFAKEILSLLKNWGGSLGLFKLL